MSNLHGIEVPGHYNGVGLHDTPGSETAAWSYEQAVGHARELRAHGVTLYKLFGSGTKGNRARAYRDNGILVLHRWWPGGAHWGRPPADWLMPRSDYEYLLSCGVALFEPGWNEFNIAEEWVTPIPGAAGIARAVLDAWEAAGSRYGGFGHLLFPSNTPGGNVDHRACYRAIVAELAGRGLVGTVRHVAIHPRPLNNPPWVTWTATNTCTFDEWRWIRDQFRSVGVDAYYWATEHGYSIGYNQNTNYPPMNLQSWTDYNWDLFVKMNPAHQSAIEPGLAGVTYWFNAGWGHWGPWPEDALVDSPAPEMPAPSPLWVKMGNLAGALAFSRYEGTPPPPPPPERAWGVDTASFQVEEINFDALRAAKATVVGIRFSGPNADRSKMIVDPSAYQHWERAGNAGFLRWGYHGLMTGVDNQAKFYAEAVGGRQLEMGWWSDLEVMALTDAKCEAHLLAMDRLSGKPLGTGVYTSLNFMSKHEGKWATGREAWLAAWNDPSQPPNPNKNPIVPKQFTKGWTLLQYTNQGIDVPGVADRICLDVFNGTQEELYETYGDPGNGEEESNMELKTFADVELEGMTRDRFNDFWGVNMKLFSPTSLPAGSVYYRLVKLSWREGWCGLNLKVIDEDGAPIKGEQVFQGWDNPERKLPPDVVPPGGLPTGYPNTGTGGFTNADGIHGWGWGEGEWFDPVVKEGPHWYWRGGENGAYSDVVCGFGWWDEHEVVEPTFMRVVVGDEPPPPPPPPAGSWRVTGTIAGSIEVDLLIEPVAENVT